MPAARPLTKKQAEKVRDSFAGRTALRDRMLFILGCNTGYRISELLSLRVSDLIKDRKVVNELYLDSSRMKGKRSRSVKLNEMTRTTISHYILRDLVKIYEKTELSTIGGIPHGACWIFPSFRNPLNHVDRVQLWRKFDDARKAAGIPFGIGTHTMRKTFGTSVYEYLLNLVAQGEKVDPMRGASKALGHINIANTERYLRFDQEKIDEAIESINI